MANSNEYIQAILDDPIETLDIEMKEWLDLSANEHRAALAKEIIALANHGGGYVVIGYEQNSAGMLLPCKLSTQQLSQFNQDAVQGVIAKFIEPAIQCQVKIVSNREGCKFPIIEVPGGHRLPIRAKASSPDEKRLVTNRVYVRRPGPNSEEPRTTDDWNTLLERCLQNRKSDLITSIRGLLDGSWSGTADVKSLKNNELLDFEKASSKRWTTITRDLPASAAPRFPHGYYQVTIALEGTFDEVGLKELRDIIAVSVRRHSGWPPFLTVQRAPFLPKAVDGTVECWIGPDTDGSFDVPGHHDFWRVSPKGLFFTKRGYSEDNGWRENPAGYGFDITTPAWRIGEIILQVMYISSALNALNCKIICRCQWTGLAGRRLVSWGNPDRIVPGTYISSQSEIEIQRSIDLSALPDALPEFICGLLNPVYELFDFFKVSQKLVEQELSELRKTTI